MTNDVKTAEPRAEAPLDLDAYFDRIGYSDGLTATLATLEQLLFAHATSIPFENLDILLGRPILLDVPSVEAKLVTARRGGYCFEQNTLLAAVLERLGFQVTRLQARVRAGSTHLRPRSHMLLRVDIGERPWLADVGFGADGLLGPLPLAPGEPVRQFAWSYRLRQEGELRVLESLQGEAWQDLYAFTLEEAYPIDYVVANHYTSTHPNSPFVRGLVVQLPGPEVRWTLQNQRLSEIRPRERRETVIEGDAALLDMLARRFGLHLPEGIRFPALTGPALIP